jgi:molybdopterin molybdotransferase
MKPGKPLAFGRIGEIPLLGLPGNPAAALVSFEQFGRAAILKMLGHRDIRIPTVTARLTERVENRGRRRHFLRALVSKVENGYEVRSSGIHGSAMLSALVTSNCLAVIPEDAEVLEPGAEIAVQLTDVTGGWPVSHLSEPAGQ